MTVTIRPQATDCYGRRFGFEAVPAARSQEP